MIWTLQFSFERNDHLFILSSICVYVHVCVCKYMGTQEQTQVIRLTGQALFPIDLSLASSNKFSTSFLLGKT